MAVFISFATIGNGYAAHLSRLVESMCRFDLHFDVHTIDALDSWVLNCNMKPSFILDRMHEHKTRIVWVDADAEIRANPSLFGDLDTECAFRRRQRRIQSGTLSFAYSDDSISLLSMWKLECRRRPHEWDQRNLETALEKYPSLQVTELPVSYCCIDTLDADCSSPVIYHHQASRRLKKR